MDGTPGLTRYHRHRVTLAFMERKEYSKRKELVENCIALPVARFTEGVPNEGNITINGVDRVLEVGYELLKNDLLIISFDGKEQCLEIQKIAAFRGVKLFFFCGCGKRCKKLYLRPDGERFACRTCNNLTYLSNRVTRDTVNGAVFSNFNRLTRLISRREKIRSPWYRGTPTKKFQKILSDAEKYGFYKFVSWQRNGIKDLQDMKRVVEIAKNG